MTCTIYFGQPVKNVVLGEGVVSDGGGALPNTSPPPSLPQVNEPNISGEGRKIDETCIKTYSKRKTNLHV